MSTGCTEPPKNGGGESNGSGDQSIKKEEIKTQPQNIARAPPTPIAKNFLNLRATPPNVNYQPQIAAAKPNQARPFYRTPPTSNTPQTTGRPPVGYNPNVVPSIAYIALLVSPYKAPNSAEPNSLVITIPPLSNFAIRGLFYHPSFRSVTAAVTPQPGAKQVLRRFLIGPQLVRTVIAKNTAALKSLSSNTAGYLAAGLVCGIPLYIVFTGSPVSLSTQGGTGGGMKLPTTRPVANIQPVSSTPPVVPRSTTQQPSVRPRSFLNSQMNMGSGSVNPTSLTASAPAVSTQPKNIQPQFIQHHHQQQQQHSSKDATKNLLDKLIEDEKDSKNNGSSTTDDIFSLSPDDLLSQHLSDFNESDSQLLDDEFSLEFWNNLVGADEKSESSNNSTSSLNTTSNSSSIMPSTSPLSENNNVNPSTNPNAPIHSVSVLPTPGTLQYSPLKKVNLPGNVQALAKKPLLKTQFRNALNSNTTLSSSDSQIQSSSCSKKLTSTKSSSPSKKKESSSSTTKKGRVKKKNTTLEWSILDIARFQKGLIRFGTAFGPIATCIGTKSSTNVKKYYHEHGGAKGYFKTLLNEHHYRKRQGTLESFDTTLTSEEEEYANQHQGQLSLTFSYQSAQKTKKRKRNNSTNTLSDQPQVKKQKIDHNSSSSLLSSSVSSLNNNTKISLHDPTSDMTYEQRREYINMKAEAIFNANDKKDFSTPKLFEDHIFPCGKSNGIIKQDLSTIVLTDYSLMKLKDESIKNINLSHKGIDNDVNIVFDTKELFKSFEQNISSENNIIDGYQPFFNVVYNSIPSLLKDDKSKLKKSTKKPPALKKSVSSFINNTSSKGVHNNNNIRHTSSLSNLLKDNNDTSNHHTDDTIPPLLFDVALSSHHDLSDLTSTDIWSDSPQSYISSNDDFGVIPSLTASAPVIPTQQTIIPNESSSLLTTSSSSFKTTITPKTPIFGKQSLFNFSQCASLFKSSSLLITNNNNNLIIDDKKDDTDNNIINFDDKLNDSTDILSSTIKTYSTSPLFINIPKSILGKKTIPDPLMKLNNSKSNNLKSKQSKKSKKSKLNNDIIDNDIDNDMMEIESLSSKLNNIDNSSILTSYDFLNSFSSRWNILPSIHQKNNNILSNEYNLNIEKLKLNCISMNSNNNEITKVSVNQKHFVSQVQKIERSLVIHNTSFYDGESLYPISSKTLNLFDSSALNQLMLSPNHTSSIIFEVCAGGTILAAAVQNKIVLYDLGIPGNFTSNIELDCIKELKEHTSDITHLIASPHAPYQLASCDSKGFVRIWDLNTTIPIPNKVDTNFLEFKDIQRSGELSSYLVWSTSGDWLASFDRNQVTLFKCHSSRISAKPSSRFSIRCPDDGFITSVCFSPLDVITTGESIGKLSTYWILLSTNLKRIFIYNLQHERRPPIQCSTDHVLSTMALTKFNEKFYLYGVTCGVNSLKERVNYLMIYEFRPEDKDTPLEFLQSIFIGTDSNTMDEQNNMTPIVSPCLLQLGITQKCAIFTDESGKTSLINLIPCSLHKLLFPATLNDLLTFKDK